MTGHTVQRLPDDNVRRTQFHRLHSSSEIAPPAKEMRQERFPLESQAHMGKNVPSEESAEPSSQSLFIEATVTLNPSPHPILFQYCPDVCAESVNA